MFFYLSFHQDIRSNGIYVHLTHLRDKKRKKENKKWKENMNNTKKKNGITKLLARNENIHLFYILIYLTSRDASARMALALHIPHIYSTNTAEI